MRTCERAGRQPEQENWLIGDSRISATWTIVAGVCRWTAIESAPGREPHNIAGAHTLTAGATMNLLAPSVKEEIERAFRFWPA